MQLQSLYVKRGFTHAWLKMYLITFWNGIKEKYKITEKHLKSCRILEITI